MSFHYVASAAGRGRHTAQCGLISIALCLK